MNKALHTDNAPAAIGPYSQAVQAEKTIYVSGQLPVDPATGEFAGEDIKAQIKQSLTYIKNHRSEEAFRFFFSFSLNLFNLQAHLSKLCS